MANITHGWFDIEDGVTAASAATMQPVLDAVRAICDKANRGAAVLDADTVSGYGIGACVAHDIGSGASALNDLREGGLHFCTNGSVTGTPFSGSSFWLIQIEQSTNYGMQLAFKLSASSTGAARFRQRTNSTTWGSWFTLWSDDTDGNGGQPPAPKPKAYSSGSTQGEVTAVQLDDTATWTNPGGTWEYIFIAFNKAAGTLKSGGTARALAAGNISGASGDRTILLLWRII